MEVDKEEHKESNKPHVHFGEANDSFDHDSNIWLTPTTNGYNVHLGFLQINHWYQISFKFTAPQAMNKLFRVEEEIQANLNLIDVSIVEEKSDTKEYQIKVELFAYREKLLKEKVVLKSCDNPSQTITLVLNARVLGKGKGTPLLRNGIQCIGVKKEEDDSDASDWQGYEKSFTEITLMEYGSTVMRCNTKRNRWNILPNQEKLFFSKAVLRINEKQRQLRREDISRKENGLDEEVEIPETSFNFIRRSVVSNQIQF